MGFGDAITRETKALLPRLRSIYSMGHLHQVMIEGDSANVIGCLKRGNKVLRRLSHLVKVASFLASSLEHLVCLDPRRGQFNGRCISQRGGGSYRFHVHGVPNK